VLLTCSMFVAYWTADHDALLAIFSDPEKFYSAAPYPFLFAVVVLLVFGAGKISLDEWIARRFHPYMNDRGANAVAS
jgi:putative oxidoreductase